MANMERKSRPILQESQLRECLSALAICRRVGLRAGQAAAARDHAFTARIEGLIVAIDQVADALKNDAELKDGRIDGPDFHQTALYWMRPRESA